MKVNKKLMRKSRRRKAFKLLKKNLRGRGLPRERIEEFVKIAPRGDLSDFPFKVDSLLLAERHVEGFDAVEHLKLERKYGWNINAIMYGLYGGTLFGALRLTDAFIVDYLPRGLELGVGIGSIASMGLFLGGLVKQAIDTTISRTPSHRMNLPYLIPDNPERYGYDALFTDE